MPSNSKNLSSEPAEVRRLSLRKEAARMPLWHWVEPDWAALLAGYAPASLPVTSPAAR